MAERCGQWVGFIYCNQTDSYLYLNRPVSAMRSFLANKGMDEILRVHL
jgi:hypothetical protein